MKMPTLFLLLITFSNLLLAQDVHVHASTSPTMVDVNTRYATDLEKAKTAHATMQEDTVRALANLFHRKRAGGTTRAVVFGILGASSLVGTLSYKPDNVTVNQGSSGSQTIQVGSSSPPAINYVFIGFSAIMVISGAAQVSKFSAKNLDALVANYQQGIPLPLMIKSKLKRKDFK